MAKKDDKLIWDYKPGDHLISTSTASTTSRPMTDEEKAAWEEDKALRGATGYGSGSSTGHAYNPVLGNLAQETATSPKPAVTSEDVLNQYLDRRNTGFSYDPSADPLYQKYRDMYMREGKLAMKDTMGKAAALTGGYGNSYAASVGQQVYNDYAERAADKIPELEQLARERYDAETQDLLNTYSLLYGREKDEKAAEYQKERDAIQDAKDDRAFALNKWATEQGVAQSWGELSLSEKEYALKELATMAGIELDRDKFDLLVRQNDWAEVMDMLNYNEGVRQYNDKSALSWAGLGVDQQNADTSRMNATANLLDASTNATKTANAASSRDGLMPLKTAEDVESAIMAGIEFINAPNHGKDDIDTYFEAMFGDNALYVYALCQQRIGDKFYNRRNGTAFWNEGSIY